MAHKKPYANTIVRNEGDRPVGAGTLQIFIDIRFNTSDEYSDDDVREKQLCVFSRRCPNFEQAQREAHEFVAVNLWLHHVARIQFTPFPVVIHVE